MDTRTRIKSRPSLDLARASWRPVEKPRVQADTSAPSGSAIGSQARAPVRTVRVSWRVRGRVVDDAGRPVPGAQVRARWIDFREQTDVGNITRIVDEAVSGADGTFEIDAGHDAESTFLIAEAEDHAQTYFHLLDHFVQDWFPARWSWGRRRAATCR